MKTAANSKWTGNLIYYEPELKKAVGSHLSRFAARLLPFIFNLEFQNSEGQTGLPIK